MAKDTIVPTKEVLVTRPTFIQRLASFRNLLFLLIISFAILTFFVKQFDYFKFDLTITKFIQAISLPGFNFLMLLISKIGDVKIGVPSIALFTVIALLAKKYKTALMILITTFTMTVLNQTLKALVGRPRPDSALVHVVGIFKKSDSFPSGHVMFYIGLYGFLLFIVYTQFKREHWLRRVLIITFSVMIGLVGVSRIYLGAHWFSDVLGAYLIGFSWLMLMIWVYDKLNPRVKST